MATYEFRCSRDGVIAVHLALGHAPASLPCPSCGDSARRQYSVPQVRLGDSRARRLIAATEASASEPAVVSAPLGARRAARARPSADPRTAKLPTP